MNIEQSSRKHSEMITLSDDLHNLQSGPASAEASSKLAVVELVDLVRDLHKLLEDYAPRWYTEDMENRVRETLAKAEGAADKLA